MSRRSRRKRLRRLSELQSVQPPVVEEKTTVETHKSGYTGLIGFYDTHYKKLLLIPFLLLVLAIGQISFMMATTGDFVNKGVSLKGGVSITIPSGDEIDLLLLEQDILSELPGIDITTRQLRLGGRNVGIIIDASLHDNELIQKLITILSKTTNVKQNIFGIETIESSLGSSFFRETFIAIIIAFIFMGFVVFLYFKTVIPSLAVILAAFSDMIITLAVINVLGIKLSTAGIAAFLMLIGYSVDTDILLSTKVLKTDKGSVLQRILSAAKTGITMNFTTMIAVIIALFVAQSEVLRQIMTIILIGLFADLINTWIQNAGILRLYMERKQNG